MDRDGTLIKFVHLISSLDDVALLPDVAKALNLWEKNNYLIIVVTNQPQVARGILTEREVEKMHHKIDTLLGAFNAKVDKYYFCPHHPDSGFKGEVKKFKKKCNCRKPGLELYLKAASKFNIDLQKSIYIGDTTSDILVGNNLKGLSFLVKTGLGGSDKKYEVKPDYKCDNLLEAAKKLVSLKQ